MKKKMKEVCVPSEVVVFVMWLCGLVAVKEKSDAICFMMVRLLVVKWVFICVRLASQEQVDKKSNKVEDGAFVG